ncbi:MAG: hypothetical protein CMK59_08255 [Proteobacteria bacterium]|nr:hypothetical protein [Pseudomonadota bacterium]
MLITNGSFVSLHFKMRSLEGDLLASTEGQGPLKYIHGEMEIDPPGLMEYLEGKPRGHVGTFVLPPEKAYGEALLSAEQSIDVLPITSFPVGMDLAPGMMFMANIEGKGELPITIMDIVDGNVQVFYGHPLAGQSLEFEVEIGEVRQATQLDRSILAQGVNPPV